MARCNATHNSICEKTTRPLAILSVWQWFKVFVDGDMFAMFAMVYSSSLPKAQLQRACDSSHCVECFQGICPMPVGTNLYGPMYELTMEIQADVHRLKESMDALTKTDFLLDIARTTMTKLSESQFTVETKVDYRIVCPEGSQWDGKMCVASTNSRTWTGLAVTSVVLIAVGLYGLNKRRRMDTGSSVEEEAAQILKCIDEDNVDK